MNLRQGLRADADERLRGADLVHVGCEAADDHDVHAKAGGAGLKKIGEDLNEVEEVVVGGLLARDKRIAGNQRACNEKHHANHEERPRGIVFFDDQVCRNDDTCCG